MATTTNFGWETPDDTDLVKDGAAAMRTLGNSIDTSFVDLKGGTTGQVLSKASNTDLDFTWVTDAGDISGVTAGVGITGGGTTGTVTITNDMATTITAAGDIVVGTGSGTYDNLPIGTTGQVLTADTTVSPYKVKWATAAAAAKNYTLINSGGTSLSGSTLVDVNVSGKDSILVVITGASCISGSSGMSIRLNANTSTANYYKVDMYASNTTVYFTTNACGSDTAYKLAQTQAAGDTMQGVFWIDGANSSGVKPVWYSGTTSTQGADSEQHFGNGSYNEAAAITSIRLVGGSQFDAGTIYVYGA